MSYTIQPSILCGGTYFALLLQATHPDGYLPKKWGQRTSFTESDVLTELIKIAFPEFKRPSDTRNYGIYVSKYKSCVIAKAEMLQLHTKATQSAFNNRLNSDYSTVFSEMEQFVEKYIEINTSRKKDISLVSRLLELIEIDSFIDIKIPFYINPDGTATTKEHLREKSTFCFAAFLLGVWHYIVSVSTINNLQGQATYKSWFTKSAPYKPGEFISHIGEGIEREINLLPFAGNDEVDVAAETFIAMVLDDEQCNETENISEGVFTDAEPEKPKPDNQILNMGVIMNNVHGKNINAPGGTFYL